MSSHCDDARLSLGAYALGALEGPDQQMLERHLASCPTCVAEVDELAAVVRVLSTVSGDDVLPQETAPSSDLFARVVSAIDSPPPTAPASRVPASAGRKPRRWLLAAAASVVLLAGAGTAIGVSLGSSRPASTTASASAGGVHLRVTARDATSGTLLALTVDGLPRNERCRLVASAADGSRHDAGSWNATYAGHARITESTDVPRSQLRRLTLYGSTGQSLVSVRF